MSTSTTTIRVSVQTRDRLATQARERGISIAGLLNELAARCEHEAIFRA
ncbi:MAG: type II toxin-antitoxin system antitoxin MazE7, partial [Mycobacterium sp.]